MQSLAFCCLIKLTTRTKTDIRHTNILYSASSDCKSKLIFKNRPKRSMHSKYSLPITRRKWLWVVCVFVTSSPYFESPFFAKQEQSNKQIIGRLHQTHCNCFLFLGRPSKVSIWGRGCPDRHIREILNPSLRKLINIKSWSSPSNYPENFP